jgi:hypothetical protein
MNDGIWMNDGWMDRLLDGYMDIWLYGYMARWQGG